MSAIGQQILADVFKVCPFPVPVITDPAKAARWPELAVLSVLAYGETEQGAAIACALIPTLQQLDDDHACFYYDLVCSSLDEANHRALEEMMKGSDDQNDFARRYIAQGRVQAARDEGRKHGARAFLLRQLRSRFGELPAAAIARVGSAEFAMIERWADRLLSAQTLADVLDAPS